MFIDMLYCLRLQHCVDLCIGGLLLFLAGLQQVEAAAAAVEMASLNWKPFIYGGMASIVAEFGKSYVIHGMQTLQCYVYCWVTCSVFLWQSYFMQVIPRICNHTGKFSYCTCSAMVRLASNRERCIQLNENKKQSHLYALSCNCRCTRVHNRHLNTFYLMINTHFYIYNLIFRIKIRPSEC